MGRIADFFGLGGVEEAAVTFAPARTGGTAPRVGYDSDVPIGGANRFNPGGSAAAGREETMRQFYAAYVSCPWLSAPIDTTARTITAGGLKVTTIDDSPDENPPPNVQALMNLLQFVNEKEDIRQLLRGVVTDIGIYADSFTEVVWLLGRPVALYSLDAATMTLDTDEHGKVLGYTQADSTRVAKFLPHQIIHVSADAPRGSLFGVGVAEKAQIPVRIWLYTAGLLEQTMKRGNPPNLHVNFGLETPDTEIRRWRAQYMSRNLGAANIGTPVTTKGDTTVKEQGFGKIVEMLATLDQQRDVILSVSGVPPSKVGIIETGNLGGGTGSSQDKTFRVNTCGPISEIVLEKFNYALCQAFGIADWKMVFGEVDWRDDKTVEEIRDIRIKNGSWTLNDYLNDVGRPTVPYGDIHILVDRSNLVNWADMARFSAATIAAKELVGIEAQGGPIASTKSGAAAPPGTTPKDDPAKADDAVPPSDDSTATTKAKAKESYTAKTLERIKRYYLDMED